MSDPSTAGGLSDSSEVTLEDRQQAPNGPTSTTNDGSTQAELAQAFRDLARGEQQAAALEAHLTSLESKLDALLASIEDDAGPATSTDAGQSQEGKPEKGP